MYEAAASKNGISPCRDWLAAIILQPHLDKFIHIYMGPTHTIPLVCVGPTKKYVCAHKVFVYMFVVI